MRLIRYITIGLIFSWPVFAEERPKFEFGLGPGWAQIPHYRGSDQNETYVIPLPYVRYYGKKLRIDREGGRYYFIEKESIKLDLSASFAPPVDSGDNRARKGMADLDLVFELGPRLQFDIYESGDQSFKFRAALPLRAAFASDFSNTDTIGYVFSPYIQFRFDDGLASSLSIGPMWASEEYHDYFYEVSSQQATADRPVYNARGGYSGSRITLASSYRWHDYWLGMFIRYDKLDGAVFYDSPLVKQNESLLVGIGFAWVFKSLKN